MPGVARLTIDLIVREAHRAAELGIPALALFPYVDSTLRDNSGSEALRENNLICRVCNAIAKEKLPVGLITDVALDQIKKLDLLLDETIFPSNDFFAQFQKRESNLKIVRLV